MKTTLRINQLTGYLLFLAMPILSVHAQDTNPTKDTVSKIHSLSEVVISANIGATSIEPGKITYKVSELASQNGGTAGDILKGMPSVAMGGSPNHNRDIRFRGLGNGYSMVLINGRNTGITGNNRETVLDQIPASSIDYIEIISSPGAEYQSDGINGIINIVLKKNRTVGLHGAVSFMADNVEGYNGSIALSRKTDKLDISLNYDKLRRTINNDKTTDRTNLKNGVYDGGQFINQPELKNFTNENLGLAVRYKPWKRASLNSEFLYGKQIEDKVKRSDTRSFNAANAFKDHSVQDETEVRKNNYYEYSTEFKQGFANQSTLRAAFSLSFYDQPRTKSMTNNKYNADGTLKDTKPVRQEETEDMEDRNYFANLDYTLPLKKWGTFRTGYRYSSLSRDLLNSLSQYDYTSGQWKVSQGNENNYEFGESTHAGYVSHEISWRSLRFTAGLRSEHTTLHTKSPIDKLDKKSDYLLMLPNVSVQINLDSTSYITAAFGKRVRRPAFKDLSPFVDNRDPAKVKMGNPDLLPEEAWTYEIGYLKNFNSFNIGANVFYRDLDNLIQKVNSEDANGVLYEKPDNFAGAWLAGIELMSSANFTKWWRANGSFSWFDSRITDAAFNGDAIKDQVKWMAKLIQDFTLFQDMRIQVSANYLGPKPSKETSEKALFFMDLGIEKPFLKQGRLMFRMSDVFDGVTKRKTNTTANSISREIEDTRGRIISAGIKWNF
jgi:outer membrane receptor for ferrienterochelin and colicin